MNQVATGKYTGTGALLYVHLGFVPKAVQVYNETNLMHAFFSDQMSAGSALKFDDTGSDAFNAAKITSAGISVFNGTAIGTMLTGTAAVTAGASAVTGTNTLFTTELSVGDKITLGGRLYTVSAIASATGLTIAEAAGATETAALMSHASGRAPGFSIGTDAALNGASDVGYYIAYR